MPVKIDLQLFGGRGSLALGSASARSVAKSLLKGAARVDRGYGKKTQEEIEDFLQNNKIHMRADMTPQMTVRDARRLDILAQHIVNRNLVEGYNEYEEVFQYLKGYVRDRLYMSKGDRRDVRYGENNNTLKLSAKEYVRRIDRFGQVRMEPVTHVDSAYEELSEMAPGLFPRDVLTQSERYTRMNDTYRELRAARQPQTISQVYGHQAAEEAKQEIKNAIVYEAYAQREVDRMRARERRSRGSSRKKK